MSITRIDGPDGNALFALEELTGQEIIRLAQVKEKFGGTLVKK